MAAKPIWNPEVIKVPKNSLVLMCGAQNSGKSTFAKKKFKNSSVIIADEEFQKVVLQHQNSLFATDKLITSKTECIIMEKVSNCAENGDTVILDAVSPDFYKRRNTINAFKDGFCNVILIVMFIDLKTLLARHSKPDDPIRLKFGFKSPPQNEIALNHFLIEEQIEENKIGFKTNFTYIFSNSEVAAECTVEED